MTDYQIRGWRVWHHNMVLTMMALQFMVEQKVKNEVKIPLLSCPDIKFFLAINLTKKIKNQADTWKAIR